MTSTPLDSLLATAHVRRPGSPEGRSENSPAFQRRVSDGGRTSPEGTAESFPQIALVVFNSVLLQQRNELVLKGHLAVVRLLIPDVGHNLIYLRNTHTERAILGLPGKELLIRKGVMHPLGRTAFDQLHGLGDRHRRRQREQHVNVVFDASDAHGGNAVLACDAPEVRPKPGTKLLRNERPSVLGAEDTMRIRTDVGHGRIQPSRRDCRNRKCQPGSELPGYCRVSFRDSGLGHRSGKSLSDTRLNLAGTGIFE